MRFRPAARAIITGLGLAASSLAAPTARADILVDSTLIPTSSIIATGAVLPTSYVVPTSTLLPTSYVLPTTSVLTTGSSVYAPTSYATTSYYRRGLFRPRRYVERTSYYDSVGSYVPTSYLATSSLLPTAYYSSSAILPTSYISSVLPTSYVSSVLPTSYVSSVLPTSYVVPTVISRPVVTPTSVLVDDAVMPTALSTSVCCAGSTASSGVVAVPPVVDPEPTRVLVPPSRTNSSRPSGPSSPVISQSTSGASSAASSPSNIPSPEHAPSAEVNPEQPPAAPVPPPAKPAPAEPTSPPLPNQNLIPAPAIELPPAGTSGGSGPDTGPPKGEESLNRTSMKPVYNGVGRPRFRNTLRGRVVSWRTGRPEEGVEVVVAHATGAFRSFLALTAATGEFSVSLPDGDWSVQVRMPSGSLLAAGQGVTATAGQVIDETTGQSVNEYLIRR